MLKRSHRPRIALPKGWPERIRSALLHVISFAHYAGVNTRSWAGGDRLFVPLPPLPLARSDRSDRP